MSNAPKQDFSNEWKGGNAANSQTGFFVVSTQKGMEELWDAVHAGRKNAPPAPKLPENKVAIGIFGGHCCFDAVINIKNITLDKDDALCVAWALEHAVAKTATSEDFGPVTFPYLVKFLPKTDGGVAEMEDYYRSRDTYAKTRPQHRP